MHTQRRPPPTITPQDFFCCWLPAELQRLRGAPGGPEVLVRARLSGPGGGTWELHVRSGQLQVVPQDSGAAAQAVLQLSVEDWRAAMVGEAEAADLLPPGAAATDLLFLDTSAQQLLRTLAGTFDFEVHNYQGRTWQLRAVFGGRAPAAAPDATIATDAATYRAVLSKELPVSDALIDRRITVTGNLARGLQVGLALFGKY